MASTKPDIPSRPAAVFATLLAAGLVIAAVNGGTYDLISRTELYVLVGWGLTLGLMFGFLPRARPSKALAGSIVALIGVAAWMAASLLWTESAERTVIEFTRTLGSAGFLIVIALTFKDREWRAALAAVSAGAVAVCVIALVSRLAPGAFVNPLTESGFVRRLGFPLNYWNAVGCWAAMTVALTLAWSAHAIRWEARGAALAGACVAATVAYLTYSRSALAGVLVALATVVILSRHRWLAAGHALIAVTGTAAVVLAIRAEPAIARGTGSQGAATVAIVMGLVVVACHVAALATSRAGLERLRTPPRRARVALITVSVIAVSAAVVVGPAFASRAWRSFEGPGPTPSRLGDPAHRFATLGGTRRVLWHSSLNAFERHPLRGTGAGTYEFVWNRDPRRNSFVRDAHSLYLESLGELGLPGTLILIAALGCLLVGSLRTALREPDAVGAGAAAGGAAALLVFCVSAGADWMWESTAVAIMALAVGGLCAGAGAKPARPRGLIRRVPAATLAALAVCAQLPVLAAAVEVRASQRAVRAGDFEEAVSAATTAVQVAPWGASGYDQRALVLERLGLGARAAADARRAAEREPTNWRHWLLLARIEAESGHVKAAVADVRRAARLNPRAPLFSSRARSPDSTP